MSLYDQGANRNIAEFYQMIVEGKCDNPTVQRAVDGTLTAILGREASNRGRAVVRTRVLKMLLEANPNATIRSDAGVKGGLARKVGPGDVIVNLPGTPHWFSEIDEAIEYVEIQVPNVDPAPGIERAALLPATKQP